MPNVNEGVWKLFSKVAADGWVKTTTVLDTPTGCLVNVSTGNDGAPVAESVAELLNVRFGDTDPPTLIPLV